MERIQEPFEDWEERTEEYKKAGADYTAKKDYQHYVEHYQNRLKRMELEHKMQKLMGEYEKRIDDMSEDVVKNVIGLLRGRTISINGYMRIKNALDECINPAMDENIKSELLTYADAHFGKITSSTEFIEKDEMEM